MNASFLHCRAHLSFALAGAFVLSCGALLTGCTATATAVGSQASETVGASSPTASSSSVPDSASASAVDGAFVAPTDCPTMVGTTILPQLADFAGRPASLGTEMNFSSPWTAKQCLYNLAGTASSDSVTFIVAAIGAPGSDSSRAAAEANQAAKSLTRESVGSDTVFTAAGKPFPASGAVAPADYDAYTATVDIITDDSWVEVNAASGGQEALTHIRAWANDINERIHSS